VPGLIAAFVFVFIPTIGEYVTPLLVGGPSGFMFGNGIQNAFLEGFNWQFGSAMGMFLIGSVAVLIAVFGRYLDVRTVAR
jgi:ABC-type spermidine/putrescine transport system permease subunit I